MKDIMNFYRNGFPCSLQYIGHSDVYIGVIGFDKDHSFYGSTFKTINYLGISHMNVTFDNTSLDKRWWMGFNEQTTYHRALEKLKKIADGAPAE
jgi:hypothetical protein